MRPIQTRYNEDLFDLCFQLKLYRDPDCRAEYPELSDRDIPEQQGALLVKPEAQGHRGQTANTTQN